MTFNHIHLKLSNYKIRMMLHVIDSEKRWFKSFLRKQNYLGWQQIGLRQKMIYNQFIHYIVDHLLSKRVLLKEEHHIALFFLSHFIIISFHLLL